MMCFESRVPRQDWRKEDGGVEALVQRQPPHPPWEGQMLSCECGASGQVMHGLFASETTSSWKSLCMECMGGLASGIFGTCSDYAKQMFLPTRIDRGGEGVEGGEGGGCGGSGGTRFPCSLGLGRLRGRGSGCGLLGVHRPSRLPEAGVAAGGGSGSIVPMQKRRCEREGKRAREGRGERERGRGGTRGACSGSSGCGGGRPGRGTSRGPALPGPATHTEDHGMVC